MPKYTLIMVFFIGQIISCIFKRIRPQFQQNFIDLFPVPIFRFLLASRQIRRRVPYAGHLMTPRRLWLNKIPTLCDVVIEFPGN